MSRVLTPRELLVVTVCGMGHGYDTDQCDPQRCHLVEGGIHEKMHPICGASTLWFYQHGVPADVVITCDDCLMAVRFFFHRAARRVGARA